MEIKKLHVEIIAPTGSLFVGDCHMVNIPGKAGHMGILSNHESVLTSLNPGEVIIFDENKSPIQTFEVDGGFAEMTGEKLLILVEPKKEEASSNQ